MRTCSGDRDRNFTLIDQLFLLLLTKRLSGPRRSSMSLSSQVPAAPTPAITRRAQAMVARLRTARRIGRQSLKSRLTVEKFAELHRLNVHFVWKCRVFADRYSPSDLRRLCALRRSDGLALNFAHVNVLTIVPYEDRHEMEQLIAAHCWSAPRAHREVKRRYRFGKAHSGGRPVKIPANPWEHLQNAIADAGLFVRKHKLLAARLAASKRKPSRAAKLDPYNVFDELKRLSIQLSKWLAK